MKRASLYSSSRAKAAPAMPVVKPVARKSKIKELLRQHRVPILAAMPGFVALLIVIFQWSYSQAPQQLTQEDIDAAVVRSFETVTLPSPATAAYEAVRVYIVRVRSVVRAPDGGELESGVGTGVVILDSGVILTNIHVVAGANRISLTFSEGLESDPVVTRTR